MKSLRSGSAPTGALTWSKSTVGVSSGKLGQPVIEIRTLGGEQCIRWASLGGASRSDALHPGPSSKRHGGDGRKRSPTRKLSCRYVHVKRECNYSSPQARAQRRGRGLSL